MKAEDAKRLRPVTMWAIHYGNGHIDLHSVRRTRYEAIEAFLYDPAMPGWDHWRKQGCSAIKVRLVPDCGEAGDA